MSHSGWKEKLFVSTETNNVQMLANTELYREVVFQYARI